jgi:sugar phosphate isomerase/epimerase
MKKTRRTFIKHSGQFALGMGLLGLSSCSSGSNAGGENAESSAEAEEYAAKELFFKISLAQWSLHKAFFDGKLDNLDFAAKAKNDFGIEAIEYVNQFFKDKAEDQTYLAEMKKRADDNGVKSLIIMVDGEGGLGDLDAAKRKTAVENHYKWVEAAKFLGCHSIRVNAFGEGTAEEVAAAAVDGLGSLATFAKDFDINVIVENHGSYSSDGNWMSGVMKEVNMANCGMLPDFGNFCIKRDNGQPWGGNCIEEYDRYKGVTQFMPFAKAVSAKSHDFDADGNEIHTDFMKMMKIVKDAGYTGYVGVEYEGSELSEDEGIMATKKLLEKVGAALS